MDIQEIADRIVIPADDPDTPVRPNEAEFLYRFVRETGATRTLEVGFAYGYSSAHIIAATNSKHIVIDPNQASYGFLGIENLAALGFENRYDLREEPSHVALPRILEEQKTFDFIFIDGGHKFDEVFVDWFYSDLLLERGGNIILHDTWMRSIQNTAEFIRSNRGNYREVETDQRNMVVFQKTEPTDDRPWHHFKEFHGVTLARLLRQKLRKSSSA